MISSNLRADKYRKKIRGLIIPGQAQGYNASVQSRIQIEIFVKSLGITPMLQFSYIAFAEQLLKIKQTHSGAIAFNEADALANKWMLRGLIRSLLQSIATFLGFAEVLFIPSIRYEFYIVGADLWTSFYKQYWRGQTFTVGTTGPNEDHNITSVKVKLKRVGADPGTLRISIRNVDGANKPTGPDLSLGTYDASKVTTNAAGEWITVKMSDFTLQAATMYAYVMRCQGDASNYLRLHYNFGGSTFPGGTYVWSNNYGILWNVTADSDNMFEIWGYAV